MLAKIPPYKAVYDKEQIKLIKEVLYQWANSGTETEELFLYKVFAYEFYLVLLDKAPPHKPKDIYKFKMKATEAILLKDIIELQMEMYGYPDQIKNIFRSIINPIHQVYTGSEIYTSASIDVLKLQ